MAAPTSGKCKVRLIEPRSILSTTGISSYDYCLNPYTGCGHGCLYCYAQFMIRFSGHAGERWGSFVDVKATAPRLLLRELRRKKPGSVLMSSVTDPYQPLEATHRLTRRCLEGLLQVQWPVSILTRSPLVCRDLELLARFESLEVGLSIGTDREAVRKLLEPSSPPIAARIRALERIKARGIPTYAFVGPILPMDARELAARLEPLADTVLLDRLNYPGRVMKLLKRHAMEHILRPEQLQAVREEFARVLGSDRLKVIFQK